MWFTISRIREALPFNVGKLAGKAKVGEAYIGGKVVARRNVRGLDALDQMTVMAQCMEPCRIKHKRLIA